MPRGPRLDAPGVLHHVMVRGSERRAIFRDERDRQDFVTRLAARAGAHAWAVYAWTLLPNHAHRLVRTGGRPLARPMGALLAGYAGACNRCQGHLFQNRYKSIVVEEDPYRLELTRDIHLTPLRAGLLRDLGAVERYAWTGHRGLLGKPRPAWQAIDEILGQFGRQVGAARRRYRQFLAEDLPQGHRPDLQGGGLRRSAGGGEGVAPLRRGRERWAFDERILGRGPFVERLLADVATPGGLSRAGAWRALPRVLAEIARLVGVTDREVTGGSRRRPAAAARAATGAVAVTGLGRPVTRGARALGGAPMPLLRALPREAGLLKARGHDVAQVAREVEQHSY